MARRGRCHRQRRLRRWSFSAIKKLLVSAKKNWLLFLFKGFSTLFQKDYERYEIKNTKEDQVKSRDDRFAGYKSICIFGLGSLFWGSAIGFLGQLEEKDEKEGNPPPAWINLWFAYSAFALVSMLVGVAASTFPKYSWLAPSLAGFGSLQALLLVSGGFHVASLKYHPYKDECKFSLIGSSIIITVYWSLSVQDPMILHFLVKLMAWLASWILYALLMIAYNVWQFAKRICTWMGENNATGYLPLPETVSQILPYTDPPISP